MNSNACKARASLAAIVRYNSTDDPRIPALRARITAERLEEHIEQALASKPPLTTAQRERLAVLIYPGGRRWHSINEKGRPGGSAPHKISARRRAPGPG